MPFPETRKGNVFIWYKTFSGHLSHLGHETSQSYNKPGPWGNTIQGQNINAKHIGLMPWANHIKDV